MLKGKHGQMSLSAKAVEAFFKWNVSDVALIATVGNIEVMLTLAQYEYVPEDFEKHVGIPPVRIVR